MAVRKGDTVLILTGKDRGKQGSVERVLPKAQRVVVTGLNLAKRHAKPSRKYPAGGIVEVAMPLHLSNVRVVAGQEAKPAKSQSKGKK